MEKINLIWDDFEIKARVLPVITLASPIIIVAIIKGIITAAKLEVAIYSIIAIAVVALLSKLMRNFGKKYERKMYDKLGAMPTTIVMRYSDYRINDVSKTQYHKRLNVVFPEIKLPICSEQECKESDKYYIAAMTHLRNYANTNRDKEQMVYRELKEYNYWRNIYGGKYLAIITYCIIIAIDIAFASRNDASIDVMGIGILAFSIIVICLAIRSETVQNKAFDYAVALAEVCERI